MRLRRKPWARPELSQSSLFIEDPTSLVGRWNSAFPTPGPLHLELGCGKGEFIAQIALKNPSVNYLAIDIKDEVLGLAKRRIETEFRDVGCEPKNVLLASFDIGRIPLILSTKDRVERIYINFPNPWPKGHHKKRRLTHPVQLEKYNDFLIPKGEIWFKTDDDELFWDTLRYLYRGGFVIKSLTCDLEKGIYSPEPRTEHQRFFVQKGVKIKFLIAVKNVKFTP